MRCFISVAVNGSMLIQARDFLKENQAGSFTDLSQAHSTLCFLGELNENEVEAVKEKISEIRFPCFELELNGVGFFPGVEKPVTAWSGFGSGREKLVELHDLVCDKIGFVEERRFFPHVTIARFKAFQNNKLAREFVKKFQESFGFFTVKKFSLMQSFLGEKAVHEELLGVALT